METMQVGRFRFERFTEVGKSFDARITIRETGQLGFNSGAVNQYQLSAFSHVLLLFDADNTAVGMVLINDPNEAGAVPIKSGRQNTYVPAKAFLDKYGIPYGEARRYALQRQGDVLYFELDKPLRRRTGSKDK